MTNKNTVYVTSHQCYYYIFASDKRTKALLVHGGPGEAPCQSKYVKLCKIIRKIPFVIACNRGITFRYMYVYTQYHLNCCY